MDIFSYFLDPASFILGAVWLTLVGISALGQLASLLPCWSVDFKVLSSLNVYGRFSFIDWLGQVWNLLCRKHANSSPACPKLTNLSATPNMAQCCAW